MLNIDANVNRIFWTCDFNFNTVAAAREYQLPSVYVV